jgi:hypothetical protein
LLKLECEYFSLDVLQEKHAHASKIIPVEIMLMSTLQDNIPEDI